MNQALHIRRKDEARTAEKNAAGEVVKPGRYRTKDGSNQMKEFELFGSPEVARAKVAFAEKIAAQEAENE